MADIKISELERVQSLNNGDLVEVSQEDSYSETGYSSKSAKMTDLGEKVVNGIEYTSELNTSNKKIIGAINEIASYTPVYGNTASGALATFDTSLALPLQDCTIDINAVQSGSGTPSPDNVRPITGFTGANIHVADNETPHIIDNVTAISWQSEAGTVYGGSLDVTTGVLTVTMIGHVFDGTENFISLEGGTVFVYNFGSKVRSSYEQTNSLNTHFTNNTIGNGWANVVTNCYLIAGDYYVGVNPNMSLSDYKTWLGTQNTNGTPVKAVATLQTPVTYQLTPTQISAIVGTNNVFTDTNGNTSVMYACSLKDYIDRQ